MVLKCSWTQAVVDCRISPFINNNNNNQVENLVILLFKSSQIVIPIDNKVVPVLHNSLKKSGQSITAYSLLAKLLCFIR